MLNLVKQLLSLVILVLVAAVLLYIGVHILIAALIIGAIAAVWFSVKYHFLHKEITATLREYNDTRFSDVMRPREPGKIIEGDYTEVKAERDKP